MSTSVCQFDIKILSYGNFIVVQKSDDEIM